MAKPHLPEELLQLVLLQLAVPGNDEERVPIGRTLAACCLVNKQLYRLAQPILYRSIWVQDTYVNTVKLLVRTMIYEPAIADHVRELYLGDDLFDDQDSDGDDLDSSMVEIESLESYEEVVNASTSLDEEVREWVIEGLSQGEANANMAMLFIICRRLELLDIVLRDSWYDYVAGRVLEISGKTKAESSELGSDIPLSQLRELRIRPGKREESISVKDVTWLFHLGQLETFRADGLDVAQAAKGIGEAIDSIKHVYLRHSFCDESLVQLIAMCPSLEVFEIQVRPESLITFQMISDFLVEYAKSLKHVYIDTSSHGDLFYEGGGTQVSFPLSDIQQLRQLQSLRVSAVGVYGRDDEDDHDYPNFKIPVLTEILPTSLRLLELFDCSPEQEAAMRNQLKTLQADQRFEHLRHVRLKRRIDL